MMKRVWRLSPIHKFQSTNLFSACGNNITVKPSLPVQVIREYIAHSPESNGSHEGSPDILSIFTEGRSSCNAKESILRNAVKDKVSKLKEETLDEIDEEKIENVLEEHFAPLLRIHPKGSAAVELLRQLRPHPYLALEVLNWRRKQLDYVAPMTAEEYVAGIIIAGRLKDVNLAQELFQEASNRQLKGATLYNALMSACSHNGMPMKCESLFQKMKTEAACSPSVVTYNMLISMYGSLLLIDHMEEMLRKMKELNLTPTHHTYRGLISGYMRAWMWHKMEKTYLTLKSCSIKPTKSIRMLMIRGYAHSGQLEKMEEMYEAIRDDVDYKEPSLIRGMICAYLRSSEIDRVKRVEELLTLLPADDYRPWLNVQLICLYADEDLLERMEMSINEAFEHQTFVTTTSIMRSIIASYFRHNAAEKLADFVRRAELAGWKICRSLYHGKMVLYASQMRLSEMEMVLNEMGRVNMPLSKRTLWILFNAYRAYGERNKLDQVIGRMFKQGCKINYDWVDS